MNVGSLSLNNRWRALWNPEMYHGWCKKRNFFEGWYFKLISPDEENAIAIIPGISMDHQGKRHAFVQVFDGTQREAFYHSFKENDFHPSNKDFSLHLGSNFFSSTRISLDLPEVGGELLLNNLCPWPKMLGAPGIMGWVWLRSFYGMLPWRGQPPPYPLGISIFSRKTARDERRNRIYRKRLGNLFSPVLDLDAKQPLPS